jgi:uncharacterized protein
MNNILEKDAIFRVGEVSGIEGRKVLINVDKNKNSSDLLFDGTIIKNVAVGSYVEIRNGFLSIIGKVDGEKLTEDTYFVRNNDSGQFNRINKNYRVLTLSLVGYIGNNGRFVGGIKELPLIGNEAFILTEERIHDIHNLTKEDTSEHIRVAKTDIEEIPVKLPIDGIFNSHIAIFGNTGSGKSNTLAALYQGLFDVMGDKADFKQNCKFLFFDFNGEYTRPDCITVNKRIYNLNTQNDGGDKITLSFDELFDIETLSILVDATEKTQKPFLKRALRFYKESRGKGDFCNYLKGIVQNKIKEILKMANKDIAYKLLDYLEEVLDQFIDEETRHSLRNDIGFHSQNGTFFFRGTGINIWFNEHPERIEDTSLYKAVDLIDDAKLSGISYLSQFWIFLHLQLIEDLFRYKVQNDHIYPVINRTKAKQSNIERIYKVEDPSNFWGDFNCVVINLHDVSLDMRKTIPLLLAKNIYNSHKKENNKKTLNIIIDEAHNILSKASFRETEEWKDYRLETFEEIIKEGRKFGVFITIASQRPSDISDTIISQAHNYFIHQLINQRDLTIIGNAVSYIDKLTEESIPTLSVGTCIFSGIATPMPLKLKITELPNNKKPFSHTLKFSDIVKA